MVLVDVNVLVYAHRTDTAGHQEYREWLETLWSSSENHGVSDLVLSGCLRVLTHPRVFDPPTSLEAAMAFVRQIRTHENAVRLTPGDRHWELFCDLCAQSDARGTLVPDAYLAALAIENGSEWITTDRDFARFPGLRWRHPLA